MPSSRNVFSYRWMETRWIVDKFHSHQSLTPDFMRSEHSIFCVKRIFGSMEWDVEAEKEENSFEKHYSIDLAIRFQGSINIDVIQSSLR